MCQQDWIADTAWIAIQIFICLITIPSYFIVKGSSINIWIYTLTTLIAYVVFLLLVCLILGNIFDGWDNAIIYWTEVFLSATFGFVLFSDIIINFVELNRR